jgi:hypothetical protein
LQSFLFRRRCLQSVPPMLVILVSSRCSVLFAPQAFCDGSVAVFFWSSCLLVLVGVVSNHFLHGIE